MKTLLLAGGGTGGHIYPAIAIAQAFRKRFPASRIVFVGTAKGLETKIIPREGFPLELIKVGALNNVGIFRKLLTILLLPIAGVQAIWIVLKNRPDFVIGVGGYASGPVVLASSLLFRRTYLFEPNAYPGLTNRWLSWFVKRAFVNFKDTCRYFRNPQVVGIPVRQDLVQLPRTREKNLKVLIFGGSQGARGINNTVIEALKLGGSWQDRVEIVHQTGRLDFKRLEQEYMKMRLPHVQCYEFLYDMPQRYAWADLVVCRSGASTLAELAAMHKAAILVPFPQAADNHQHKNAEVLSLRNAAILIPQAEFTPQKFIETLSKFIESPETLENLESEISKFHISDSATNLVNSL